jgi:cystathionine beta-lyase/cystathionine gamma-synthase
MVLARNAHAIALFLDQHDAVAKVTYPGLKYHPQHAIAKRQQHGFGAMITFYCIGGREQSSVILRNVSTLVVKETMMCPYFLFIVPTICFTDFIAQGIRLGGVTWCC